MLTIKKIKNRYFVLDFFFYKPLNKKIFNIDISIDKDDELNCKEYIINIDCFLFSFSILFEIYKITKENEDKIKDSIKVITIDFSDMNLNRKDDSVLKL